MNGLPRAEVNPRGARVCHCLPASSAAPGGARTACEQAVAPCGIFTRRGRAPPIEIHHLHRWDPSAQEPVALQRELAARVDTDTPLPRCRLIAGCDVSYDKGSSLFYAGVVVLRTDDLAVVERRGAAGDSPFPYVP